LAVTDWRLRRWRLWFLALSNAPQQKLDLTKKKKKKSAKEIKKRKRCKADL